MFLDEIGDGIEAKVKGKVQSGVPALVLCVGIGATSDEEFYASSLTVLARDDERCVPMLVSCVQRNAFDDQLFHLVVTPVTGVGKYVSNL